MRKLTGIVCACAVMLAAPSALAGGKKYEGDFLGAGYVSFKVENRKQGKKVVNYKFRDLVVDCGGTEKLTSGRITFAISVKKKRFGTTAVVGSPSNPKSSLKLKGKLKKGNALGTLHVFGSEVNVGGDPPERDECDSGKTSWRASR